MGSGVPQSLEISRSGSVRVLSEASASSSNPSLVVSQSRWDGIAGKGGIVAVGSAGGPVC